jgi:flagellar hook-basal body complex protein FliE
MTPIAPIALQQASRAYSSSGIKTMSGGNSSALAAASTVTDTVGGVPSFGSMISNAAHVALQTLRHSEKITALGVAGKADVQDVVQAASDAEVTVKSTVAVLSKVQSAYNDIMRMSV